MFRDIEAHVGRDCILASDTSGIPITHIQAGTRVPGRVIGMHWSNPPHIIPMIEVVSGEKTAPEAVDACIAVVSRCGHLPITIRKDVPGFVENRVLYAVMRECLDLVEQGVIDPQDLDACVSWGIGYKLAVVGPMALARHGGARHLRGGLELSQPGAVGSRRRRGLHHGAHRSTSSASRPAAASTTTLAERSPSFASAGSKLVAVRKVLQS